jgi:hypothetical protein
MKKILLAATLFSMLIVQSCSYVDGGGFRGEGNIVSETRNIAGFKGVELNASGNVLVKQGSDFKVTVETHKNVAEQLLTEVEGDILKIYFKNNWGSISYDKLIIYIEMPALERLELSGSGIIKTESAFQGKRLDLFLGGSGDIDVKEANFTDVKAEVTGSGNIEINGASESADYLVSGSGDIDSPNLKAKNVKAEITGSGGIDCYAETDLDVFISGSGNVGYSGNPAIKSRITGSGDVEKH